MDSSRGEKRKGMDDSSEPYIILVGDVGSGKSTLVEKLTGMEGRSSSAKESFTRESEVIRIEGKFKICDTPGTNAMKDALKHNVWIAKAINYQEVSKLFIVVRADKQMENVVETVNKYKENFLDFPEEVLGVCVTHMDLVPWGESDLLEIIEEETGITSTSIIFSKPNIQRESLLDNFIRQCGEAHSVKVDTNNFSKHFKLNDINIKISKSINKEVNALSHIVEQWKKKREEFVDQDNVNLIFEFHAWIKQEIKDTQKRIADDYSFKFQEGCESCALETGHIASLTSQLQSKLKEVETEINRHNSLVVSGDGSRICPYCFNSATKNKGFDGFVTCGDHSTTTAPECKIYGDTQIKESILADFSFSWNGQELNITKSERKGTHLPKIFGEGCGRTMSWSSMAPVLTRSETGDSVHSVSGFYNKRDFEEVHKGLQIKETNATAQPFKDVPVKSEDEHSLLKMVEIEEINRKHEDEKRNLGEVGREMLRDEESRLEENRKKIEEEKEFQRNEFKKIEEQKKKIEEEKRNCNEEKEEEIEEIKRKHEDKKKNLEEVGRKMLKDEESRLEENRKKIEEEKEFQRNEFKKIKCNEDKEEKIEFETEELIKNEKIAKLKKELHEEKRRRSSWRKCSISLFCFCIFIIMLFTLLVTVY